MQKKVKYNNCIKPLYQLTREPSLKLLPTEKEINKRRNISIDFSISPFKSQKKIIKRNARKNSFSNAILNQTESTLKTRTNNLSYMPIRKLLLNIPSLKKNDKLFSKKKFNVKTKNNKSFNVISKKNNAIISQNQINFSIIKKNYKNLIINTQPVLQEKNNKNKIFKTLGTINDNNKYNISYILNKKKFPLQLENSNITNYKKIINKKKLITNKKPLITNPNINTYKKIKKNKKNNLSTNFKISRDDFIKVIKNTQKKYNINKGITPPLKEKQKSFALSSKNLNKINDENIKLLCENVKLKRKNEELISKINYISKEFNEIKKDNNDIKEELKEKNNMLNNIKLTMDIFNQELIRLQQQVKDNNQNNNNKLNNNFKIKNIEKVNKLNIKEIEINENNEKTPSTGLGYTNDNKKICSNDIKLMNNSKNKVDLENKESITLSDENNISLAENLNINEEEYKKSLNKYNNNNNIKKHKNNTNKINNFNLIIKEKQNEICSDFNQEFLKNVDNFSESWRKEAEKLMKRK
jgi:hypothetical protein